MDYKSILLKIFFSFSFLSLITACGGPNEDITVGSIKTSPEPLRIIGTPPSSLFYDSPFEFEFGASGGDGEYRYRYIQNPVSSSGESINQPENPVEMSIQVLDSAKPAFKIIALPTIPEDTDFDDLEGQSYTYQIELTDGKNTITREFDFTLQKNQLSFVKLGAVNEGAVNNTSAVNLLRQLKAGETRICNQLSEFSYEKHTTENGETVYPFVFHVFLEVPVFSRTELFYRLSSAYSNTESERNARNIGKLRPGVDYIDQERSIVFEPGESVCVGFIEMLDDSIIEEDEELRIEFFKRIGGAVDFEPATISLSVRDNEPLPTYVTENITRNMGDTILVPIKVPVTRDYPVDVHVSVDQEKTTADESEYTLEPSNGVVTIDAGELNASYSVKVLNKEDPDIASVFADKIISLATDIDRILDVDPFTIEINQWPRLNNIENEIIASESNNEKVINFSVDGDGIVTTLIEYTGDTDVKTRLKAFYRDATPFSMTAQDAVIELGKNGLNLSPKAIGTISTSDNHKLIVVANVNGLYGDVYRGGVDFVVLVFNRARGEYYTLESVKQYGSEGDDIVTGAHVRNNILYVFGKTNGQNFENQPSDETNNGGEDGFLYVIEPSLNVYSWSRFMGTAENDIVADIDAGNRDLVALISTNNSDLDAFVKKLSSRTGQDATQEEKVEFRTPRDDKAVSIRFDSTANTYRALLNSTAMLSESNASTPTLSQDAQLLLFDSEGNSSGSFSIATAEEDQAVSMENMPDNKNFVVIGNTYGELADNQKKGTTGRDAFATIFSTASQSGITLKKNIQFGTPGDDQVIAIKSVSNTKFLVLWKENFTQTPSYIYRISAFSIDGRKLSPDPD